MLKSWFLGYCLLLIHCYADEEYEDRPRGVSAEKASLYEEKEKFQCLDGSKSIPWEQLNDDYCDCEDASDEPGTSACSNGHFHCRNYGFRPMDIPSSRVNDFICDCCDGSDEWDSGVQCSNVCDSMGKEARDEATKHKSKVEKGWAKRQELAKEGGKSMEEKKNELEKMKHELDDLQPIKEAHEASKTDAETRESDAKSEEDREWNESLEQKRKEESTLLFETADVDKNGKLTIDDMIAAVKTASGREISADEVKSVFGDLTEIVYDNFHEKLLDLRRWYRKEVEPKLPSTVTDPPPQQEVSPPPSEDEKETTSEDVDDSDDLNDEEPEHVADEQDHTQDDEYAHEKRPDYSEATSKLIDEATKQRNQLQETQRKVRDLERDISDAENFLQFEYGPDHAWAPLKGQCPEMNQAQYTYKLCLFDRAIQKDKNGRHEIGIGNWRGWEGGDNEAKYTVMKYADGQHCWNGPARSTKVHVECGEELELFAVSEPAKCEYEYRLRSPAACPDPATLKDPYAVHTEL